MGTRARGLSAKNDEKLRRNVLDLKINQNILIGRRPTRFPFSFPLIRPFTLHPRNEMAATPLGSYAHLLPPSWKTIVPTWLAEDTPSMDFGGFVVGEGQEEATLWGKSEVRPPFR